MTLHRRFQSPPPERRGRRRRCMAMTTRMYVVTNQHDEPLGLWLSETLIVTGFKRGGGGGNRLDGQ